jgi:acyl dehydratase
MMFARAVGDPNPVYYDEAYAAGSEVGGIIAPPTFAQASAHFDPDYPLRPRPGVVWHGSGRSPTGAQAAAPSAEAEGTARNGGTESPRRAPSLHAEQHFTYHRQLRPGDVLTATTRPGTTWEREGRRGGKLSFSEGFTEYRDQDGSLVVTARFVGVRTEHAVEKE